MKKTFFITVVALLSSCEPKNYRVEITFCDSRPKDTVIITTTEGGPDISNISNYEMAVPMFRGYLNVCDVRTLEEIKP